VTALLGTDLDRAGTRAGLVVGVVGSDGPQLLIFASPQGALRRVPEAVPLPAPATALATGHLDGDSGADLAVAAGAELVIVHGRGRRLPPDEAPARVTQLPLGRAVTGLVIGHFTRGDVAELALLGADGTLSVLAPGTSSASRGRSCWQSARGGRDRGSFAPTPRPSRSTTWWSWTRRRGSSTS
jgi:hypothetical protein